MSETCPGCGAEVREEHVSYRRFGCMTLELDALGPIQYELREDAECLRRQLSQAQERIKELEAQRERTATETDALRRAVNGVVPEDSRRFEDLDLCVALNNHADLATVAPVVRAAIGRSVAHGYRRELCSCPICTVVRTMPADVRERITGVTHEG